MTTPPTIIPAAGLGTRLRPLTDTTPKELLPLGGQPAILGSLLEAQAAGIRELVVVLGPGKEALGAWLDGSVASGRWAGVHIQQAQQPEPLGVLDAVERGRAVLGLPDRYVVLFPDYVHLPEQRGLSRLLRAAGERAGSWFGLIHRSAEQDQRMGRTAAAWTRPLQAGPGEPEAGRFRIEAIGAPDRAETPSHHTTFAVLRCAEHQALIDAGPLDDGRLGGILGALAERGLLFGAELSGEPGAQPVGELLDLGVRPGYDDAVRRFDCGEATWRPPHD